ncbi:hypothetical protein [Chryseobacterium sp. CFS15]|uniref:hypothetical protein n=1 Tax=Chryseobacterium sp. CFS15 TaxID=2986946 RepID=UPI0028087CEB|nr:hypothetical protein [Chryseobacterium sp. CFS15]MDQ8143811.1 hypothetical protein [Chryseobacterium sp. CFS15]
MKKNLLLRLCLIMTVLLSLYSCIHEEIISSSDPSTEYINKSLWKEDETYIKNVMQVYFENEAEIKKANGIPFWNYATTVETFDERFLMVPVVSNNKVVSVLQVPRRGSKIYFYYTYYPEHISFFQALVFGKHKKAITRENSTAAKSISCTTQTFAIWYPADESNPDPESGEGSWGTRTVVVCRELLEDCVSIIDEFGQCTGGGGNDPGYQYPGGGSDSPPKLPPRKNPCEKTKVISTDPAVKAKIEFIKEKADLNGNEFGFKIQGNGETSAVTEGGKDFWDPGDLSRVSGLYHCHSGDGVNIFSPPDIHNLFPHIIISVTSPGGAPTVKDVFKGIVGSAECNNCPGGKEYFHYIIRFNGTMDQASTISSTNYDMTKLKKEYKRRDNELVSASMYSNNDGLSLNSKGVEKLFFETLDKMEIAKDLMILQSVDSNGNISTIKLNPDGTTEAVPCP